MANPLMLSILGWIQHLPDQHIKHIKKGEIIERISRKMTRFKTFWIQMRNNKPLDEIRKSSQTSGTKMAFYSINLR
ncbi:hypothetical protein Hanom_Chr16g01511621 [Helianthus anomalus]